MEAIILRECEFEGAPLPVYEVDGKPHWIARQVGVALGYGKDGSTLVTSITRNWKDAFAEGDEVLTLKGKKLQEFKGLVEGDDSSSLPFASVLMLLSEKGLHKVLMLTRQPAGDRMRDWLAGEVLPQIVRDGRFLPDRRVVDGQLTSGSVELAKVGVAQTRADAELIRAQASLERAQAMGRNAETRERESKRQAHERAGRARLAAGTISPIEFSEYMVHASEYVVGGRIERMHGNDPHGPWLRARDMARLWKIPEQTIGKAAVALGLRGNIPGMVREVMGRRENSGGSAVTHEYSVQARAEIKEHLDRLQSRQGTLPLGGR